ncbi:hypothetical protein ACFYW8_40390 [Streptomyces sp. NPDC002742]|uniref:hypothetical protein n=1 Tax=Streptomyces sp. NPDC002742 TaxID=3364663 RepID=UPI00367F4ED0
MAFEESFLTCGGEHRVHRLARVRQPQRELVETRHITGQHHADLTEVDLCLSPRQVRLRNEHGLRTDPRVLPDLRTPVLHIGADHRIRDLMGVVLVHQPVEDPLSCVPLLGRRVQIRPQDPVDQRLVWIKPRFTAPVLSARLRPLAVQSPTQGPPRDVVLAL